MLIGESTNPFNILRVNYELEGKKKLSKMCSLIFVGSYIVLRGFLIPFVVYMVHYSDITVWYKLIVASQYWVTLIWMMKILNLASKELAKVRVPF